MCVTIEMVTAWALELKRFREKWLKRSCAHGTEVIVFLSYDVHGAAE